MATIREVVSEFRSVVLGRGGVADAVLPPVAFVLVDSFASVTTAAIVAGGVAMAIVAARLAKRRRLRFALSGLAGTLLAAALASGTGRPESYFLPGIVSGALSSGAALVSILVRRPLLAFASWLTRGWPLGWYWHDRVRPAYSAATWLWFGFFLARTVIQWSLYVGGDATALGVVRAVAGWPAVATLLVLTYLIGRRRLERLGGPSVDEFVRRDPPPWTAQQSGF